MPSTFIGFIQQLNYSNQSPVTEVNLFTIKLDTDQQTSEIATELRVVHVLVLPALNTVRKLHFYKLAFLF